MTHIRRILPISTLALTLFAVIAACAPGQIQTATPPPRALPLATSVALPPTWTPTAFSTSRPLPSPSPNMAHTPSTFATSLLIDSSTATATLNPTQQIGLQTLQAFSVYDPNLDWTILKTCDDAGQDVRPYLDSLLKITAEWESDFRRATALEEIGQQELEERRQAAAERLQRLDILAAPECAKILEGYAQEGLTLMVQVWDELLMGDTDQATILLKESVGQEVSLIVEMTRFDGE
jgi:hypothetical protein